MKMGSYYRKDWWRLTLAILCLVLFALSGCAMVGSRSISVGRADYNEAINKTEDEQMLLSIVKGRYGETFSLLAVSGVTANIRFRTNAGVQAGFGPSESYAGNLVPFSGGLAYEENPTIAYSPVQGEKYLRQLMSPIPLDILLLLVRSGTYSATYLNLIANRINGMRNPDFLDVEPDPRFQRFTELNYELYRAGMLHWVEDSKKEIGYEVWITGYAPNYSEKVREYITLLGLPMPTDESKDIVDKKQDGHLGVISEVLCHGECCMAHTKSCARRLIHLPKHHDGVFQHARFFHFAVEFLPFATPFTNAAKEAYPLMLADHVVDHLHDKDRLPNTCTPKQSGFSTSLQGR